MPHECGGGELGGIADNGDQQTVSSNLLLTEQLQLSRSSLPTSLSAILINTSILVLLLWQEIDHLVLSGWWLYMFIVIVWRAFEAWTASRHQSDDNLARSLKLFSIGSYLSAMGWSASTVLLFVTDSVAHQVLLAFVIAGTTAGASATLSPLWRPVLVYILVPLIPLLIQFFMIGDMISLAMGTMVTLYLVMMISVTKTNHYNTLQNIRLRIESNLHEKIVEESERKFRLLFESVADAIFILDMKGNFTDMNPVAYQRLGYSKDELMAMHIRELDSEKYAKQVPERMGLLMDQGHATFESEHRHKDGTVMPVEVNARIVGAGDDSVIFSVIRDLTERKQAQAELLDSEARFQQAQKMESIGTLVGGIAHDFNNMLAALLGNLYLAKSAIVEDPQMTDRLNRIELVSQRAADMIAQLLMFARKGKVEMVPLPIKPFLNEIFKLARPSIPENIDIALEMPDEDFVVMGDLTQLQQVLLNLVTNASHAVEAVESPRITIGLKCYQPDGRFHQIHTEVVGEQLLLLYVQDNGEGIAECDLDRVFEPFYTTKEQGKGSGLGLSMVHGAIKMHKGAVEIDSSPGRGTTIKIYLSIIADELSSIDLAVDIEPQRGIGEGILLVDDDEIVLEVNAEVLEDLGYQVFVAEDGLDAQKVYQQHADQIALAVLDLVMPKMGGMELLQWLREQDSELPVILMTGYDREQVLPAKEAPAMCMVLNKPVDIPRMSQAVHAMIEGD